jgi:hypothetical protein
MLIVIIHTGNIQEILTFKVGSYRDSSYLKVY